MRIDGTFKTKNDDTIKVSIYNKAGNLPNININTSNDVRFAGDQPVVITQQQDDTFEHILTTQCKITLVTKRFLGDYLFADNTMSIVVNVWRNNECIFAGFVTPLSFNQNYSHVWEELEINAVDMLSTLKDRRLTDSSTYEELVAQSTIRPFSWFISGMNLNDPSMVIPNLPDIDTEEMLYDWVETGWTRNIQQDNSIDYYGVESQVLLLDEDTAVATGTERQGALKTVTWVLSDETCIVDGMSYYKEYAHITVNGEDVNTGDWRASANEGTMPQVVSTRNEVDGWTTGVLPQPFDFYEHYTTYLIYDNGMEFPGSDGIGDQIPEYPSTTTNGSYYEFRQGANDDVDVDEQTGYIYYKDYAWVCVNNECTNSGQWQRGAVKAYPTGTHTVITGWQYDTEHPRQFEYYETISHYTDYSDGTEVFTHTTMGHQIPLYPSTTTNGSYYENRQAGTDDLDYDSSTDKYYYKNYAWVTVNSVSEKTNDWSRGNEYHGNEYTTIEATSNGNVTIHIEELTSSDLDYFSYSLDGQTWNTTYCDGDNPTINIPTTTGDKLYMKGEGIRLQQKNHAIIGIVGTTCTCKVYGNVMSLLYGDDFADKTEFPVGSDYTFAGLFLGGTNITDVSDLILPATRLAERCYSLMFENCYLITSAPELPATTLADYCYKNMFNNCTSLINAPELPATTLATYCYGNMFEYCTSLTTAPELPATTLATYCYQYMFNGCTALTTAPELPATTLADYCYQHMFRGCTALTTAPELPATTLADYCYRWMFKGCTNLSSITMLATNISATSCLNDWVSNVYSSGTFTKSSSMTTLPTGDSGIPSGWTVVDAA